MEEDVDSKLQMIGARSGAIKNITASHAADRQIVKTDIECIKRALVNK